MLIKNLLLIPDRQDQGKIYFKTDNGSEITLPDFLFGEVFDKQQQVYLSVGTSPLVGSTDDKKKLLNELLNDDDHD